MQLIAPTIDRSLAPAASGMYAPKMNYFVLVGSDRERSQSAKVAAYISDLLCLRTGTAPHVLNLSQTTLPPWDADNVRRDNAASMTWAPNRDALVAASGIVIVDARVERNGSARGKELLSLVFHERSRP